MVDQDPDATTDEPMKTTHVGIATVPTADPDEDQAPPPTEAPAPPPPTEAPVDEVLHWLGAIATVAGQPDGIDVSATTRHVAVTVPDRNILNSWGILIGAVAQMTRADAIGTNIIAMTDRPERWSITVYAHVIGMVTP